MIITIRMICRLIVIPEIVNELFALPVGYQGYGPERPSGAAKQKKPKAMVAPPIIPCILISTACNCSVTQPAASRTRSGFHWEPPQVSRRSNENGGKTLLNRRRPAASPRGSHPLSVPDMRILHALRQLGRIMEVNSRKLARERGVTSVQLLCLSTMALAGTDTATAIAAKAHVSSSTVVGILDRLENKELVTRERDLKDRRVVRVNLTDAGREVVRTTLHPVQDLLERKFNGLTLAGATKIAESLESLVGMLGGRDAHGPPGERGDDGDNLQV